MKIEEAREWLKGNRSTWNTFSTTVEDHAKAMSESARADAGQTEQAYWIVKAHEEGLTEVDDG